MTPELAAILEKMRPHVRPDVIARRGRYGNNIFIRRPGNRGCCPLGAMTGESSNFPSFAENHIDRDESRIVIDAWGLFSADCRLAIIRALGIPIEGETP